MEVTRSLIVDAHPARDHGRDARATRWLILAAPDPEIEYARPTT